MKRFLLSLIILLPYMMYCQDTLTIRDVFDFNVGDTLDYRRTVMETYIPKYEVTYRRDVITSKSYSQNLDTIFYEHLNPEPTIFQGTITNLDSPAFTVFTGCDTPDLSFANAAEYLPKRTNTISFHCFEAFDQNKVTQNLGQTYFYNGGNFDGAYPQYYKTELVYYSNGSISIGTPYEILELTDLGESLSIGFKLSPSPAGNWLNVSLPGDNFTYKVFDAFGRLLITGENHKNELNLDVTDYPSGLYFLSIGNKGAYATKKFVVEH